MTEHMRDPLVERCTDVFRAATDADYSDEQAMCMVFHYLSAELGPLRVDDPLGLWDDYIEGQCDLLRALYQQSKLFPV
jgi:hypothetical protein